MAKKGRKNNKPVRRRRNKSVPGMKLAQGASATVGMWGPALLDRLPNGFASLKAGEGKGWWKNKRVLLILVALVWCIQSEKLKYRMWAFPLAALFGLAVTQHKLNYGSVAQQEALIEVYAEEKP